MSRFISAVIDTKAIHADWWDVGEGVIIKKFSYGDRQRLAGAAIQSGVDMSDLKAPSVKMDLYELTMLTLELGIQSWNFADEHGQPVPLTRDNLAKLQDRDGEYIAQQIEDYNPSGPVESDDERIKRLQERIAEIDAQREKKSSGSTR